MQRAHCQMCTVYVRAVRFTPEQIELLLIVGIMELTIDKALPQALLEVPGVRCQVVEAKRGPLILT